MISQKALEDPIAISLAEAVAVANEYAQKVGYNTSRMRLLVEQDSTGVGIEVWRFNYFPTPPPGLTMRGGDFMVEINADDGTIHQALRGQ